jgi:hypothetical protein
MTEKFDYSCAEVTGLHYSFARMDEGEIRQAREALEEEKRQAAQAAAAAAEAKARAEAEAKAAPEAPPAPEAGGSEGPAA